MLGKVAGCTARCTAWCMAWCMVVCTARCTAVCTALCTAVCMVVCLAVCTAVCVSADCVDLNVEVRLVQGHLFLLLSQQDEAVHTHQCRVCYVTASSSVCDVYSLQRLEGR